VLTVHDLVALEHPDLHPPRSVVMQRAQLRAAITRADVVIAVSHATANTLKTHGVDPDRIVVAPNGATRFRERDRSVVPDDPYVLAVGSLTPRKGFETLVAAFAGAGLPSRFRLVIAGADGWDAPAVRQAIERHDRAGRVICTGRVSDAQLAALYEGCTAACVPSVAEGFGLPVVEAAALGAVVLASDLPVFNEINGGVVLHAPPGDVDAWAGALARVVGFDDYRREAERRACAVAERYTWERSAALTLAAYERASRVLLSP
jgi:glycosyltransferase involved in cell wall biosynthesis